METESNIYDIIIIGAGPAGLTSAIYACRASKRVLVLEAETYGGQIINTLDIENYPAEAHISGVNFATKLYAQAEALGAEMVFEKVTDIADHGAIKEVVTEENTYKTKSIIIATGLQNRKLELENEDELIGKGISYCATCDGAFYKEKTVAVVGGGNTALEDALHLSGIAAKVYLIHRRDEFRGEKALVDRLREKPNVEFVLNSRVTKANADEKITSITVVDKDGVARNLDVDGLFVAIGKMPDTRIFAKLVNLDESGYIISDENCHTNVAGVFVAGDNRTKDVRQLVTAIADGAVSAIQAARYLA